MARPDWQPLRAASRALRRAAVAGACALLAACAAGPAHPGLPEGAPVRLGADLAEVRQALGDAAQPERGAGPGGELTLALDARGIWVQFDRADRVRTLRLRAPWAAPVLGVRIGDTPAQLLARLGQPALRTSTGTQTGYTYHPDEITILTYMVGADRKVDEIFVVR